jgi:hypothetical protein
MSDSATPTDSNIVPPDSPPRDDGLLPGDPLTKKGRALRRIGTTLYYVTGGFASRPKPVSLGKRKKSTGPGESAGAIFRRYVDILCQMGLTREQLQKVATDPLTPQPIQVAAIFHLQSAEYPDLATFEPYLNGTKSLAQLREEGVSTSAVKKAKAKTVADDNGNPVVTREIELFDRNREAADLIIRHTAGELPREINHNINQPMVQVVRIELPEPSQETKFVESNLLDSVSLPALPAAPLVPEPDALRVKRVQRVIRRLGLDGKQTSQEKP